MSTFCTMLSTRVAISAGTYAAGTWSGVAGFEKLDLDLNTLSTVPTGSTCAIFHANTNSVGARFGVQDSNGADLFTVSESAVPARQDFAMFIPINGTKTVDVFTTNTTNETTYLMGYMSHPTFIAQTGVSSAITAASVYTIDLGTTNIVPAGAAGGSVIVMVDKLCKMAGTSAALATMLKPSANVQRAYAIVPLDAARKFYVQSYATFGGADALTVVAWMAPGAYVPETTYTSEDITTGIGTAFAQLSKTSNGVYDHWRINSGSTTTGGSTNVIRGLRPSGDTNYTIAIDGDTVVNNPYSFVKPNGSGLVDGYATVANAAHYERHGTFVADTAAPNIVSISSFVAGASSTVVFDKSLTSVTRLRVAIVIPPSTSIAAHYIDITSFSGSGTTWTFTVPDLTNATDGIRLGDVVITPTTAPLGNGADFTGKTYTKTGYTPVNMEDVLPGNVCDGDTPALITDDQIAWNSTLIGAGAGVDVHGIYSDPRLPTDTPPYYVGTQTMWHYATDFKWYSFTVTTTDPVVVSGGGLTSSGLTSSGLTRSGLTSVGLVN